MEIWPEAAETVNPAEIRKMWSDEKMRDFAKIATEDMESGGVREACARAVQDEALKIDKLQGSMFRDGYRNEGENTYCNQQRRIEDQERNARTYAFDEVKDKVARDPLLVAIARGRPGWLRRRLS